MIISTYIYGTAQMPSFPKSFIELLRGNMVSFFALEYFEKFIFQKQTLNTQICS